MSYKFHKNIKTLELDSVLNMLANEATMLDAKLLATELTPSSVFSEVENRLKHTEDAYLLMAKYSAPSFGRASNIISSVARADLGSSLSIKELLEVAEVLRVTRSLKDWGADSVEQNNSLYQFFEILTPNKFLENKITFSIKSEDELSDSASPLLADIRRKITIKSASIRDTLERIVRGPAAKYLQENIITQRDGRFVVPVKAEHKNDIKGLVHDTSATGSTPASRISRTARPISPANLAQAGKIWRSAIIRQVSASILTAFA